MTFFFEQEKFFDIEVKYKDAMVSQAKLFDEKTSLVYQVESLKDELEDTQQEMEFVRGELQHHQSVGCLSLCLPGCHCHLLLQKVLHAKHTEEVLHSDIDKLKTHIRFRDDFMQVCIILHILFTHSLPLSLSPRFMGYTFQLYRRKMKRRVCLPVKCSVSPAHLPCS